MKQVFTAQHLNLTVADKTLAKDVCFEVRRGDRVAIIGKNGTGKSTLIKKIVAGEIPAGGGVTVGYFDQENSDLHPENTVLDELWGRNHRFSVTEVRNILGRMLFRDEDVEKRVGGTFGRGTRKAGICPCAGTPRQYPAARRTHQPLRPAFARKPRRGAGRV